MGVKPLIDVDREANLTAGRASVSPRMRTPQRGAAHLRENSASSLGGLPPLLNPARRLSAAVFSLHPIGQGVPIGIVPCRFSHFLTPSVERRIGGIELRIIGDSVLSQPTELLLQRVHDAQRFL